MKNLIGKGAEQMSNEINITFSLNQIDALYLVVNDAAEKVASYQEVLNDFSDDPVEIRANAEYLENLNNILDLIDRGINDYKNDLRKLVSV